MWGIIPAAGAGSRIQPLAFSKELLPVGSQVVDGQERPRAVSEYLVERMVLGGASKLCFVISPGKTDILSYYGSRLWSADIAYVVQPAPGGLCDAVFRAAPLIGQDEQVIIGLPDTVWSPEGAIQSMPDGVLSLLLFPVDSPEHFDAVVMDEQSRVREIQVKRPGAASPWIWGVIKMPGTIFHALHRLWHQAERCDEYFGTLINAWIANGGEAFGVRTGNRYVDVGTVNGYRRALQLLNSPEVDGEQASKNGVSFADEAQGLTPETERPCTGIHATEISRAGIER
jgi:dTDP-glucose pyrophosphorylase